MNAYKALNFGGIAIVGRSGSGKSSSLFGSDYVTHVIIADTGSMGHRVYSKVPENITVINALNVDVSPVKQVYAAVEAAGEAGELYALDSFSTLQEQEVSWLKKTMRRDKVSLDMHQMVVGSLRDLALTLASTPGFTLFNTSPGGRVRMPNGEYVEIPQGCLTGYPSLSGLAAGSESLLARFTSVLCAFPGFTRADGENGKKPMRIARGFILQDHDFRPDEARRYCPVKDPMQMLQASEDETPDVPGFIPVHGLAHLGTSTVDAMIDGLNKEPLSKGGKKGKGKGKKEEETPAPF